jgi:uncharacterized protein
MPEIALFPLNTVLFPGGLLPLRIFEPRYIDMVGRCLRSNEPFGVVLVMQGADTDRDVETATVGSSARIVDFQTLEDGLLGLLCRGERRFRIRSRSRRDDGLNCAQIDWLAEPERAAIAAEFSPLIPLLREAMEKLTSVARYVDSDYDSAAWVSYRLAELLPLDHAMQQRLLEIDDSNARLGQLAPLIQT